MGTTDARRRAWPPLVILLILVLLLGDAASTKGSSLSPQDVDLPLIDDASWRNETVVDPAFAAIARRAAAGGYRYDRVRWMIALRCPRRAINEAVGVVTKRCYAREVRRLEESLKPPPPELFQAPWMLRVSQIVVDPWPRTIVNPVIRSKSRWPLYADLTCQNCTRW